MCKIKCFTHNWNGQKFYNNNNQYYYNISNFIALVNSFVPQMKFPINLKSSLFKLNYISNKSSCKKHTIYLDTQCNIIQFSNKIIYSKLKNYFKPKAFSNKHKLNFLQSKINFSQCFELGQKVVGTNCTKAFLLLWKQLMINMRKFNVIM